MKLPIPFFVFLIISFQAQAQLITLSPSNAGPDDQISIIFDASEGNGELANADKIYMHHGATLSAPDGTDWNYVIGNWGQDDGVGAMTKVPNEDSKWQITLSPTVRAYFNANPDDNIFRISAVFRNADGSQKGTINPGNYNWGTSAANLDIYINLNIENFVTIEKPNAPQVFVESGSSIELQARSSNLANSIQLYIDEGSGFQLMTESANQEQIQFDYFPSSSTDITVKVVADINGTSYEDISQHEIVVNPILQTSALPDGLKPGINYHPSDPTQATLVIEAPNKDFVYAIGDFTDWELRDDFFMNKTPDGEFFWLNIDQLSPGQEYVFQYWVDGIIKIGDPYTDKVMDPWNDPFISESTYPNLISYDKTENGLASVLQTGQSAFNWAASETTWQRPDQNHLVIYELHIRDFLKAHSFEVLTDTLSYLKRLGINAIELMPVNEFEGNESWGYNPSYFFAPDKYYGPKNELKKFIQAAHQQGIAVIMDIVMNHAFGQNPMVRMYFDQATGKPSADNPWFNREYVGQYQWGYDFNHESPYTQRFLDRLNAYWIEEYHFDGFRFDFTKGFTNNAPGGSVDGFDQSRINILKRMADEIRNIDPASYIILEHWAPPNEENQLANEGMIMWSNRTFDFTQAISGANGGSFNDMDRSSFISLAGSHDERRLAEEALLQGRADGSYNIKDPIIMFERMKLTAAFNFLLPGPKMIWQFDELAYDIDINFNGRTGNKPKPWGNDGLGYYEDPLRQYVYQAYSGILDVRNTIGPDQLANATTNHQLSGSNRRLSYNTDGIDLVVIGNFGLSAQNINPQFPASGRYYDYFSGDSIEVNNPTTPINLKAGEWHIYTTEKLSEGLPGVVSFYENPVTINPNPFGVENDITVRFDATKASASGTEGLVGAEKVYFHSGVVQDDPLGTNWSLVTGTLSDDGLGLMTEVDDDIWEIQINVSDYYGITDPLNAFRLGMYFRDADNSNLGKGFRDQDIYFDIESDLPFVFIDPPSFGIDDEITITFNARKGNKELLGFDKVYMHSGVNLSETNTPWIGGWQNVIGNWGQDDGIGEMQQVANQQDLWSISLVPSEYYNLNNGSTVHWISAVFRSADGSVKGTGTPGNIENGIIHSNLDFFIKNQQFVDIKEIDESLKIVVYPNPSTTSIYLSEDAFYCTELIIHDVNGKVIRQNAFRSGNEIDISSLENGFYYLSIICNGEKVIKPFVKLDSN